MFRGYSIARGPVGWFLLMTRDGRAYRLKTLNLFGSELLSASWLKYALNPSHSAGTNHALKYCHASKCIFCHDRIVA